MKYLIACIGIVATFGCTRQVAAQPLPAGNYVITGSVIAIAGTQCPLGPNASVTGALHYVPPGVTTDSVLLTLSSVTPSKSINTAIMTAFPPVPTAGLNGWSAANPVHPNYSQWHNSTNVSGDAAAVLSFDVTEHPVYDLSVIVGRVTLEPPLDCKEKLMLSFQRVGA